MRRISFRDVGLKYVLSPYDAPVARIKPGETIVLEVEDACSGQIKRVGDQRDRGEIPYGNPVVGPIYVEGASVGDTLSISIKEVKPMTGKGTTYLSEFNELYVAGIPLLKFLGVSLPYKSKICEIRDGRVYFNRDLALPYQPMIGTIGVAPNLEEESISSAVLPGRHGGNMDLPDVCPGSILYLPVFHDGALLYVGDAHAVQGEGEISGTAVEMPAEVEIEMSLIEGESVNCPRIETEGEVMFVATTSGVGTLEDAIRTAYFELIIWMEEEYGLNRFDGLMLCSQVGRIRVGNLWTVAAKIGKKYLKDV